jgi:IS4 transposase
MRWKPENMYFKRKRRLRRRQRIKRRGTTMNIPFSKM